MKKSFPVFVTILAASVLFACGISSMQQKTVFAAEIYRQDFSSYDRVSDDFSAYYQLVMGAPNVSAPLGKSGDEGCNWYVENGCVVRKPLEGDIDQSAGAGSVATLTYTKKQFVNFELKVDYKMGESTYFWPVVAFRQADPGRYFLEDGAGVFVQREGMVTLWGGEGVGGPYEGVGSGDYRHLEWHTMRIVVSGVDLKVYLDGSDKSSLERKLPESMFRKGYVSLVSVNNDCAFRNFEIGELPVTAIEHTRPQKPEEEASGNDALTNLGQRTETIDELQGLKQKTNTVPTQPENNGNGGALIAVVVAIAVLVCCGVAFFVAMRKRQRKKAK